MIQNNEDGSMLITGSDIEVYRLLSIVHALALEIRTGMVMSRGRSTMKAAAAACGSTKRTKLGVLRDLVAYMEQATEGRWSPSPSIRAALV